MGKSIEEYAADRIDEVLSAVDKEIAKLLSEKYELYPLTIVKDRYIGVYSGGKWTAWNHSFYELPAAIDGDDVQCMLVWDELLDKDGGLHDMRFAVGATPEEAIAKLSEKVKQREEENRKCEFVDSGFLGELICSACGEAVGTKAETQRMRFCPYCGKRRTRNEN